MQPWYIATERFTSASGDAWEKYVDWSGLTQLDEVISLDMMLCPVLLAGDVIPADRWPHIVNENYMLDFFVDLPYLLAQIEGMDDRNLLCVYRNPATEPVPPSDLRTFELVGYDLVDRQQLASALTNCGGFPDAFDDRELNAKGLLPSLDRANAVQAALRAAYPDHPHADCHVWAIFRAVEP
jgi:hypothetical protein